MRRTPPAFVPGCRLRSVLMSRKLFCTAPDFRDMDTAQWLKGFSTESRLLRWVACSDFLDLHKQFIEEARNWPENSTFAYWWQTLEDRVLRCIEDKILASTTSHCSLHFDGFMVHRNVTPVCSLDEFRCHLEQTLENASGFRILFALKEHHSFAQLLRARAGGDERVLPDDQQSDTGTCLTASACALCRWFHYRQMDERNPRSDFGCRGRRLSNRAPMVRSFQRGSP